MKKSSIIKQEPKWYFIDARDKVLGRLASKIAYYLRGKEKPSFQYYKDFGNYVVVVNCDDIKVTGRKLVQKKYRWHTQYPGGLKERTLEDLLKKDSRQVVYLAVKGMLPRNKLSKRTMRRLKLFRKSEHPYKKNQSFIKINQ